MSSLEISIEKIMQVGTICLRLTALPGMIEALTAASLGVLLFDMPFTLALALGYILSAVSPAIVVPSMISLKNLGYGAERGIPTLVMAAASFDDLAAITGFTVSIGIALDNSKNIFLSAFIHGPVQLFIGVGTGLFMGVALATTRFCLHQWQRTLIALELSVLVSYLFKCIHLDGVGAGQFVACFSVN
jgi:NhaP-type Na+/H+ or K+/H+ antiporter